MSESRLPDYLDHMQQAAQDACAFVDGLDKADFFEDKRTQQAVVRANELDINGTQTLGNGHHHQVV